MGKTVRSEKCGGEIINEARGPVEIYPQSLKQRGVSTLETSWTLHGITSDRCGKPTKYSVVRGQKILCGFWGFREGNQFPYYQSNVCVCVVCTVLEVKLLSRVRLFATPWTVDYQALPSMGFSLQEYWSGLPFPSPEDLPNPGVEPRSPAL